MRIINKKTYILYKDGKEVARLSRGEALAILNVSQATMNTYMRSGREIEGHVIVSESSKSKKEAEGRRAFLEKLLTEDPTLTIVELVIKMSEEFPDVKEDTIRRGIYHLFRKIGKQTEPAKKKSLRVELDEAEDMCRRRREERERPLEIMPLAGAHGYYWRVNKKRRGAN